MSEEVRAFTLTEPYVPSPVSYDVNTTHPRDGRLEDCFLALPFITPLTLGQLEGYPRGLMETDRFYVGRILRDAREYHKYSKALVAKWSRLTVNKITRIEKGTSRDLEACYRVALTLGLRFTVAVSGRNA